MEKLVCLKCGDDGIDEFDDCPKCGIQNFVPLAEHERWCRIKGTLQLYVGDENHEPSVILPLHLNQFGWIVADVINTTTTIFPSLSKIVEYDRNFHRELLTDHQINYHTKCIEALMKKKDAAPAQAEAQR